MPTTASIGSSVQTTSMATYSTTTAVSETIEPMLDDYTDRTTAALPSHYHAFIITPILSLVVVGLIIILIVAIVKLKKGDRQKSRVNRSPDKIEGE